ncbi:MAG: hypothetical protein V3T05_03385 [Myxococcota bacterium]
MSDYETERLPDDQVWSTPKQPPSREWFLDLATGADITGPVPWRRVLPWADTEDVVLVAESRVESRDSEIWDEPEWRPEPERLDTMAILRNELHSFLDESRVGMAVQRLMAISGGELAGMAAKGILFVAVVAAGAFGVGRGFAAMTSRKAAVPEVAKLTKAMARKTPELAPATTTEPAPETAAADDLARAGATASTKELSLEVEPAKKQSVRAAKKIKKFKRIKRGKSGKYEVSRAWKKKHKSRKGRRGRRRT